MKAGDYVFSQIYRGSLKAGATERAANDHAVIGLQKWKNGQFKSATALIAEIINSAKKFKAK